MGKTIIISVISDIYTDQRVLRTLHCVKEMGYNIILIGRKSHHNKRSQLNTSLNEHPNFIHPLFTHGVLMYLTFNILLFIKLFQTIIRLKKNSTILLYSNDLDTLLPNFLISKLFYLPIIYDTHELFTEVPELKNKPLKKFVWKSLEKFIVPKLPFAITVNESIAQIYHHQYHIPVYVIRNISNSYYNTKIKSRKELGLPEDKKIIILQGTGINIHRGAEELTEAMQYLDNNYLLLIIGGGDVLSKLKQICESLQLKSKIIFLDRMPASELYHYTANANIGISIDKPNNLNYLYSLPNKIFSYIHAHIPILSSRLPEIEKIITHYNIGNFIDYHEPQHIAEKIIETIFHPNYLIWKKNTYWASEELSWEKEKQKLKQIIASVNQ